MPEKTLPSEGHPLAPPLLPGQYPVALPLDPGAALAYRTPLQEHPPAADTKAAGILTASGMMFTLLARYSTHLSQMLGSGGVQKWAAFALLSAFVVLTMGAVIQAFRTISPRFPPAQSSLAFFGDIASLTREEYVARVEALSQEQAIEEMLSYNHTLSLICVEKFRQLRRGVQLFEGAFLSWLVLMLLIGLRATL
jgi:pycsar effector protein